jgi:pyruvate dehydrogenase complex dehydrogenase (E1) component
VTGGGNEALGFDVQGRSHSMATRNKHFEVRIKTVKSLATRTAASEGAARSGIRKR